MEKADKEKLLKKLGIDKDKLAKAVKKTSRDYRQYVAHQQQAPRQLMEDLHNVREQYTRTRPLHVEVTSIRHAPAQDERLHYALDVSIDADEVVSTPRVAVLKINNIPLEVASIRHDVARGRHGLRWRLRIDAAAIEGHSVEELVAGPEQHISGKLKSGRPFDGCYRGKLARSS